MAIIAFTFLYISINFLQNLPLTPNPDTQSQIDSAALTHLGGVSSNPLPNSIQVAVSSDATCGSRVLSARLYQYGANP